MTWRIHLYACLASLVVIGVASGCDGTPGCDLCAEIFPGSPVKCEKCMDGFGFNADGICVPCRQQHCQSCHFDFRDCNRCGLGFGLAYFLNSRGVWEKTCRQCRDEQCIYCGENAYQCLTCREGYAPVFGEWVCKEKWDRGAAQGNFNVDSWGLTTPSMNKYV